MSIESVLNSLWTGEEIFTAESGGGTLSRRGRRNDEFTHDNNARNGRHCLNNGKTIHICIDIHRVPILTCV